MTFWLLVAAGYGLLLGLGLGIGRYLARRFPGNGRGRALEPLPPTPAGPTFGVEWPPLGSEFDRLLLPGAFTDTETAARV